MFSAEDQNDIRTSTIYLEFMKALRSQTIQPTKHWTYDISPAIEFLLTLGPNITITEEQLNAKTCWLLAMAHFLRPSDLERVDLHATSVSSDGVLSLIIIAPKEKPRGQRIVKTITIHSHHSPLLCPVAAFEAYVWEYCP
ncbi:hypothetical protein RMCBS344292_12383 [Rhizopus microsporus]|nr:hypothetical protein RMCBS344292_12383 [Rhizopus microsporus]